jgi:hypothetical protein
MPEIVYTTTLFTGSGLKNASGNPVSFRWAGISVASAYGSVPGSLDSILNGSITVDESAQIATYPTTAFNGFAGGYAENAVVQGTIDGYLQPKSVQPTSSGAVIPRTALLYFIKVLIGTHYHAAFVRLSDISEGSTGDDVAYIRFRYQVVGIPLALQSAFVRGGAQPPLS